mmetsp:Transcript_63878/g.101249  ORF Transcript_63878/g.101249 Transcript_63878/m.101249 type:complete len:205 (-) Transcript_63878:165-779(-)
MTVRLLQLQTGCEVAHCHTCRIRWILFRVVLNATIYRTVMAAWCSLVLLARVHHAEVALRAGSQADGHVATRNVTIYLLKACRASSIGSDVFVLVLETDRNTLDGAMRIARDTIEIIHAIFLEAAFGSKVPQRLVHMEIFVCLVHPISSIRLCLVGRLSAQPRSRYQSVPLRAIACVSSPQRIAISTFPRPHSAAYIYQLSTSI